VRELQKFKGEDEIMAEEITVIIMNGGILTLNPMKIGLLRDTKEYACQ
jgi:hypothetical protein